jgi:putative tricarboxylic transport membrane protein
MKNRDRSMATIWILLGLIISIWSSTFPFGTWDDPGPAFFPLGCGFILIALGSVLFFLAGKRGQDVAAKSPEPLLPGGAAGKRVYFGLGGILLSAALFETLGFVVTCFLMILFLIRITDPKRKWSYALFYSVVSALVSYVVFKLLLKTELPAGFLGF